MTSRVVVTHVGLVILLSACFSSCVEADEPSATSSADAGGGAGGGDGGSPPFGCGAGKLTLVDGSCAEPGVPPSICPPGATEVSGACIAPGVPPSECGQGFQASKDQGCSAIVPNDVCPKGTMAIPGEITCRSVAPCDPGEYGSIPIEANSQFVNGSYAGGDSDGSVTKPWTTISDAIAAAAPSAIIAIAEGVYNEDLDIMNKPVRIWGKCPSNVEIHGSAAAYAAIHMGAGADGTEIRDIAVTGVKAGIDQDNVEGIRIERVWVHDTG